MSYIITSDYELNKVAAPNLPLAPIEYTPRYIDQLNNVLRLYFNRLDALLAQLNASGSVDPALLNLPNGAFHQDGATVLTGAMTNVSTTAIQVSSTATFPSSGSLLIGEELVGFTGKTSTTFTGITRGIYGSTNVAHAIGVNVTEALGVTSASVARSVPFTSTDFSNGVALNPTNTSRIEFTTGGRYNIQFSAQLYNSDSADDIVKFWFRQDGVDVPFSAGVLAVAKKTGAGPGQLIATWNIILDMAVGSYFELYYASQTGNTVIATFPAGTAPVTPISPSVILTVTYVSGLP